MMKKGICWMGCNCARRARRLLSTMGYEREGDYWVKGTERVLDEEVEKYHTRETAKALFHLLTPTKGN